MPWRHSTAATEEILLITALSGLVAPQDFLALVETTATVSDRLRILVVALRVEVCIVGYLPRALPARTIARR